MDVFDKAMKYRAARGTWWSSVCIDDGIIHHINELRKYVTVRVHAGGATEDKLKAEEDEANRVSEARQREEAERKAKEPKGFFAKVFHLTK